MSRRRKKARLHAQARASDAARRTFLAAANAAYEAVEAVHQEYAASGEDGLHAWLSKNPGANARYIAAMTRFYRFTEQATNAAVLKRSAVVALKKV